MSSFLFTLTDFSHLKICRTPTSVLCLPAAASIMKEITDRRVIRERDETGEVAKRRGSTLVL